MKTPSDGDKEEEFFEATSDIGSPLSLLKDGTILEIGEDELDPYGDIIEKGYADFTSCSISLLKTILGAGMFRLLSD